MHLLITLTLFFCSKPTPLKERLSYNCKKKGFLLFKRISVLSVSFQYFSIANTHIVKLLLYNQESQKISPLHIYLKSFGKYDVN